MPKTKAYIPPHFADQDAYAAALERELAGYRNRVAELQAMGVEDDANAMTDALSGEDAVLAELKKLGHGQEPAPKRSAKEAETK